MSLLELANLYLHQKRNYGNEDYILSIKELMIKITNNDVNWKDKINGEGMCSEWRNSKWSTEQFIENILNE